MKSNKWWDNPSKRKNVIKAVIESNKRRKGEKSSAYIDGRSFTQYYCKDCGKEITYQATRCRECFNHAHSKEMFGVGNPMYGKKRPQHSKRMLGRNNPIFKSVYIGYTRGKGSYYKGTWMRSTWEIAYAKHLDKNNIRWLYEPTTFDLGTTTYTPDFYLLAKKLYVEIKGWWDKQAKEKFKLFRQAYPNVDIIVLQELGLKKEGVQI